MDQYYVIANTLIIVSIIVIAFIATFFVTEKFRDYKYEITEKDKQIIALKNKLRDELQLKIKLKENHLKELNDLVSRMENTTDPAMHIVTGEFYDILMYYDMLNKKNSIDENSVDTKITKSTFKYAITCKYKLEYLYYLYPELSNFFYEDEFLTTCNVKDIEGHTRALFELIDLLDKNYPLSFEISKLKNHILFLESSQSNLTAVPYMSKIMADYETYGLEFLAKKLEWGNSQERAKKVKSIREIRKDAQAMVEKNKEAQYQLAYLLNLFPALEDVIEADFNQLPAIEVSDLSEYDSTRDWLTKEEYLSLSTTDRNQLALDRYKSSKNKSKWQIGRDYELYIGYKYSSMGFKVDYFGSYMGLEDLGRDLIAKKDGRTVIVQCKYWSQKKQIHEKHIMQLYGTAIGYCIENNIPYNTVSMVLITNIQLSPTAKKYAEYLHVQYKESVAMGDYPCIKCNIGHNEYGNQEKIYHLPFDQKYDATKIDKPGEFFAMTVEQAENAGFRRAFKWFSS